MRDVAIPLQSRRTERRLLLQRAQHSVLAVVLLGEGVARVQANPPLTGLALAAAELVVGLLVIVSVVWSFRSRIPSDAQPQLHHVDLVDLVLAALFAVDAWSQHADTGHWSRPTLVLAVLSLVLGLAHGPIATVAARRRSLRMTNRGLSLGGRPFGRFEAQWAEIAKIEVRDRTALIQTHDGRERQLDLADLRNVDAVRDALKEAEILRTAKRRFGPKQHAGSAPLKREPAAPPPSAPPADRPASRGPVLIERPTVIEPAGNLPKRIEEYAGRVNSGHRAVSVARMVSPAGWLEPGQRPEFEEITVVLRGLLRVEHDGGTLEVRAGQAIVTPAGQWIRYSTPAEGGAEYVAVCLPAFSPETVHRDPAAAVPADSSQPTHAPIILD